MNTGEFIINENYSVIYYGAENKDFYGEIVEQGGETVMIDEYDRIFEPSKEALAFLRAISKLHIDKKRLEKVRHLLAYESRQGTHKIRSASHVLQRNNSGANKPTIF